MRTNFRTKATLGGDEVSDVRARARAEGLARLIERGVTLPRYTPEQVALLTSDANFDIGEIASEALAKR